MGIDMQENIKLENERQNNREMQNYTKENYTKENYTKENYAKQNNAKQNNARAIEKKPIVKDELYVERKKKVLDVISSGEFKPMKYKELVFLFQLKDADKPVMSAILQDLIDECKIMKTPKGKYQKLESLMRTGTFTGNAKGFGFVTVEGENEDYFIPIKACNGALHQDTVLMKITNEFASEGRRKEGEVVRVLTHGLTQLVGTFDEVKHKGYGFIIPDNVKYNSDIFIPKSKTMNATRGQKVLVEITDFGSANKKPEGKVVEILGNVKDPGTDVLSVVRAYEIPEDFPDAVTYQVAQIPTEVSTKDIAGRKDFRDLQTVTIDGEDAKDLDDAITLERIDDGYRLGVHIADVSHYVTEYSPLDTEAIKRGTSVYLVDRVIPMLPKELSNGICSLNQGKDRLTLSCVMDFDEKGKITGHEIVESVINVDRRMTYTAVNKIIEDQDAETMAEYEPLVPMFFLMKELADLLRNRRNQRGSIDFDFPESKIVLDEKGFPIEIKPYERLSANKLIEDFMLAANETIAEDYFWQDLPFVYRCHEAPDSEKIKKLTIMINNFGYYFKTSEDSIHPKEYQKLLEKIAGSDEEAMISRLTLRSMKQAKYTTECNGHFGLSTKYYCHFTSPIRRYPDLQIHRIIKENIHGKLQDKRIKHYDKLLPEIALSSSKLERRADEAEREVEKIKKVEYMSKRKGEIYEGVVSGVSAFGVFVELPNTVEGLVHVTNMNDDFYFYNEEKYAMIGEATGKIYTLGQKVKIKVKDVDYIMKTIDFTFES